jgi:hypothetical protein
MKKPATDAGVIAKAERILNRTLAYQAAIAVHELKEVLGLDIEELHLTVTPLSLDSPGTYRVTCTIASLAAPQPVILDLVVEPEKVITTSGDTRTA